MAQSKVRIEFVSAVCGVLLTAGCGMPDEGRQTGSSTTAGDTGDNESCLNIVNGAESAIHPSVVLLLKVTDVAGGIETSICTGTFISGNTLITAAHCIDSSTTGGVRAVTANKVNLRRAKDAFNAGVAATKVFHHGKTGSQIEANPDTDGQIDLAVMVFPNGTAPAVSGILGRTAEDGEDVEIVGYGRTALPEYPEAASSNTVIKRYGKNSAIIDSQTPGVFIVGRAQTSSTGSQPATDSLASVGDSGGPMLVDGKIAGVTSMGSLLANDATKGLGFYVDLNDAQSLELLNTARQGGADIENTGSGGVPTGTTSAGSAPTEYCAK